jgi:L-seryl-tRNA(Ser) seleniumtransferase
MHEQGTRLQPVVQQAVGAAYSVTVESMSSQIGSGALPIEQLQSRGLVIRAVKAPGKRVRGLDALERALRALPRPVIGRLAEQALWLDLRCLEEDEEAAFVAQFNGLRV